MRGDVAIEDENIPIGKEPPQVIEGTAVTKAKFKDVTLDAADERRRALQAIALGLKALDRTIESAHFETITISKPRLTIVGP